LKSPISILIFGAGAGAAGCVRVRQGLSVFLLLPSTECRVGGLMAHAHFQVLNGSFRIHTLFLCFYLDFKYKYQIQVASSRASCHKNSIGSIFILNKVGLSNLILILIWVLIVCLFFLF
jgi:hypothetical protein